MLGGGWWCRVVARSSFLSLASPYFSSFPPSPPSSSAPGPPSPALLPALVLLETVLRLASKTLEVTFTQRAS